jgi:hypothetical protein
MKKMIALLGIVFLTVSCNPGNSGGVLICERMNGIHSKEIFNGKERDIASREQAGKKKQEPLLLLRILTQL